MVYGFDTISSSPDLAWMPCFDDFKCTKLQVPLDYANPSLGTTDVAFIKRPGKNATADSPNIVFIFGGPGGSGVELLLAERDRPGAIFGEQYNAVFFDPRGVNNSGLTLDCFSGNADARTSFTDLHKTGITNTSTNSLQDQFYSSAIYSEWCQTAQAKSDSPYAYYVTTLTVAHDLLSYVEAEARASGNKTSPEDAKLWAYGVSYGTVTGQTFATLFPSRVGRLVLDGVIDAEQHYDNFALDSVDQSDAGIEFFAETCHAAGANQCAFWGPSAANILGRLDSLIEQLRAHPVAISGTQGGGRKQMTMVTQADIKMLLFQALYDPVTMFPGLADTLHDLEGGNASALAGTYAGSTSESADFGKQILCADVTRRNKLTTVKQFAEYVQASVARSRYVGDLWPIELDGVLCSALRPELPDSILMRSPVGAIDNPTTFPILFTSNTIDPISALTAAKKATAKFVNSVLLQQEGVGHTVVAMRGSPCYFGHIQAYMAGIVPAANTKCPREYVPFQV
ncbi:alpha/beta hydrolase [Microdochium nivale]|nr:alpha/beta hydrolase [Microdochium nivale]